MPNRLRPRLVFFIILLGLARGLAQAQPPAQAPPGAASPDTTTADRHDVISDKQHHFLGKVEMHSGDTTLYADEVWSYTDEDRVIATGNVLFRQGNNQISSDRAEFNTKTHFGTFYNASGFASVQPPRQAPRPGTVAPPPIPGQETVVLFFGETVEKIGPRKYKIVDGGFTTCVQPTPRWNLTADTIILNVDHYTFLRNMVMTVKGVPMLYLPVLYYPTNKGDRATGFLLPTYGSSTLRGQSIHNAFFWAVDRSQDATIAYDWFSKTGQGVGSEYRYNFGGGDDGNIRAYMLDQHEATYPAADGSTPVPVPASRSYEIHGAASQTLPFKLRARGSVDYFSSFTQAQTFSTNVAAATQSTRRFGGNVVGAWGTYTLNGTFDHTEYFGSATSSTLTGGSPRVAFARNERPIPGTPLYFSVNTEYARLLQDTKDDTSGTLFETDLGLTRLDVAPQIRFPFKKWQWFTVNSTLGWRDTYYTRSYDPAGIDPNSQQGTTVIDSSIDRRFFTAGTQITGPVFTRIWDTPDNGYAEKFKHSIEPTLNIQRTSSIDNFNQIVKHDGTDYTVGGATQFTYGVANRFYAKRRATAPGRPSQAREILTVELQQTYYTDDRAALFDRQYATSQYATGVSGPPSHFSPIALSVRATPSNDFNASARAEFDPTYKSLRTISVSGQYSWEQQLQTTVGWSKKNFIPELAGFNDPTLLDQSISVSTTVHTQDNRFGGIYAINYDVLHSTMVQQRMTGFYNAQCCGLAFEYQNYHYPTGLGLPVLTDHRFFLSFTLAGLGNFSPFNGALGGVPR